MPGPMNNISSRLVPYWCAPGARSVRDLPEDEHGPAPRPPRKSQSHRSLRRVFSQASISSFATTQPATDSVPPVPPLPSLPIVDLSQAPPNAAYAVYTIGPNGVPTLTYAQAPPNGIPMTPTGYTPPPSAPPTTTYMPMGSTASFAHAHAPTLAPPPVVAAPQVIPATQSVISIPATPAPQQIVAPSVAPNAPVNPPTIATQAPTPTSASPSTPTAPVRKPYKLPEPFLPRSMGGSDRGYRGLPAGLPMMSDHKPITQVDPVDASTPDKWINRNPDLVRHTGKHPINAEVRLEKLFDSGFLTPSEQFYIRSHGGVPQVTVPAADWQVKIHGLVDKEISLSIRELSELFPVVTLPVTVVCAGNRRKEQMIIQKGIGFNWGPAAVSTALFTGVYLADILEYVGVKKGAKHVIFEGADALPNGNYGTSQYLSWCKNKSKGIMVAWLMNGLPLEPDHGFPLRAVTPGHVGGRFVKWLHRIEVSVESSNHHLHHFDNKLLPTQLSAEVARAENHWWYEEKYIINELNVNSVIARPQHDETITFHSSRLSPSNGDSLIYALEGYAYSGGGRRITRVEISLDHGDTWRLAEINYPEDKFRDICHNDPVYGTLDLTESETSYAWCFWKFNVPVRELANSHVVCVRAMDAALATQPRDMYWNASCMMNNWWFRVAIHKEVADDKVTIRFEHPTLAGPTPGGWMERMKNAGLDPRKPIFGPNEIQAAPAATSAAPAPAAAASSGAPAMTADGKPSMLNPAITREITMEEVQAQPKDKPWFIVDNEVYDGTGFLEEHPGGADSILLVAGEDASEDFHAIHSNDGRLKMIPFHIGHLVKEKGKAGNAAPAPSIAPAMTPAAAPIQAVVKSSGPPFLNPRQWKPTKVTKITRVSHDSSVFRFALESGDQDLGLPCGQHVFIRLRRKDTGELVQRAYTPLSDPHIKGYIDILIKVYLPSPEFPAGGKMTMGFNDLVVGDSVDMKGPLGSFIWTGPGSARWKNAPIKLKNIGLISAGSGITPIMQILRAVLNDPNDTQTKLWLLDANKTEQDILCREDIDTFHEYHPDRLKVHHTLSRPTTQNIGFSTGRINDAMMAAHLPPPGPDSYILICGPDPLIKQTVEPGLRRLGWDTSRTFVIF